MTEKHLKECSTSLAIKKIQIKIAPRFHLTPVRMGKIKITKSSLYWKECGSRGTLRYCWSKFKLLQTLLKSICWLFRKLENDLPQDPAVSFLGKFAKAAQSYHKEQLLNQIHFSIIHNS